MPDKPKRITLPGVKRNRGAVPKSKYGRQHRKDREQVLSQHPLCCRCSAAWATEAHSPSHHLQQGDLVALCSQCHREVHREEEGR